MGMTFKQVSTVSAVGAGGGQDAAAPVGEIAELFRAHHVSLVRLAL
ncbi:MAG: hypothetical protein JWP48_3904 [Actinoallomurus sp.]|jgi:hypothetical protein|nr:hypothetical protein [Actinoallomurus sp.]